MPVFVDIAAFAAVIIAIVRVASTDPVRWRYGRWSQAAWTLLAVWLVWNSRYGAIPLGAVVAVWKTHRLHHPSKRHRSVHGADVPFADGIPIPFDRPTSPAEQDQESES